MGKTIFESLLGTESSQQKKTEKKKAQYYKLKEELLALEQELFERKEEEVVADSTKEEVKEATEEEKKTTPTEELLLEKENMLKLKEKELKKREKQLQSQQNQFTDSVNLEPILKPVQQSLDAIKELVSGENAELISLLGKTEDRLQRRDSDLQCFQEDFYRKSITPYIRQFISLGDMMRKIMYETIDESTLKNEHYWHEQFGKIIESINYILRDFSFTTYQEGKEGDNYLPQKQEVISYKETQNAELDKKISRSLNPGYVWTLPYIIKAKANGTQQPLKEYELIFRKEQVETYKLI